MGQKIVGYIRLRLYMREYASRLVKKSTFSACRVFVENCVILVTGCLLCRHAKGAGDLGVVLTFRPPLRDQGLLVLCEPGRASKPAAFPPGARPALCCALLDQGSLELGKPAQDSQDQPAGRGCRIGPAIGQGFEAGPLGLDIAHDGQQIECRAGKAVKPGDDKGVILLNGRERLVELRAILGPRAAHRLLKDQVTAVRSQLLKLSVEGLARCGDAGISDGFHTLIMHAIFARAKRLISLDRLGVHKSCGCTRARVQITPVFVLHP